MKESFTNKYGGVGKIFDAWERNALNQEIGNIYEENVFGQESINMNDLLNEFYGKSTGGAIKYSDDLGIAKSKGIVKG